MQVFSFPQMKTDIVKSPVLMKKVRIFFCRAVKIPVVLGEVELKQTGNR